MPFQGGGGGGGGGGGERERGGGGGGGGGGKKSEAQRKFLWSQHPEIAKRWGRQSSPEPGEAAAEAQEEAHRQEEGAPR